MNAVTPIEEVLDVLIVGAGLSGIGMAVHLTRDCPGKTYAILDRRDNLGGTWDLFRYPGIRSDSDMHTLGFSFEPWTHEKAIADGPAILEYLDRIVSKYDLPPKMRMGQKVVAADWDSQTGLWTVTAENAAGECSRIKCRFLFLGSGYYDYDSPYDAQFPGRDTFRGTIVHPQFWPGDLDYAGKKVVVIGSGATAVTIVPAMVDGGAGHVTMLQRTPTWIMSRPAKDAIANRLRKFLPDKVAYSITRAKNILLGDLMFKRSRNQPDKVIEFLEKGLRENLGPDYDREAFTPPYKPWEQRLCFVPDADLFNAIKAGKADVVTDQIERFDETGIQLKSGKHIDADIIVTATGLSLSFAGKIAVSVDGQPVDFGKTFFYRNCMFSNVPNMAGVFGYLNASWTLRVDIVAQYITRLLNQMDAYRMQVAVPAMPAGEEPEEDDIFDFSSGYIQRGKHLMPRNAAVLPWRLNQDYRRDRTDMRQAPIDDGVLQFRRVEAKVPA
ncbi:cation diffusion facilitator CzcD-associated flavoprotein CzcO [Novosphingobium kunmingense]|uniref:Cation diffusion facilitator CzcD-associated flavoprotein CzcO n=1 Tax=Novosphingobium kunmingense TaxID=1211806 RepID=A0A2N0HKJ9_9SPHN|nr:NAD(P)/FAD-dependent oxidoreductase [Novosphingobium kunmingense]PKB19419.1 cation diffusion facilitator CzcD-associated flavoprotein CzcO [Novosphingobium kunmingense]